MKAKLKLLGLGLLTLVIVFSAYLLNLNTNIKKYENENDILANANHIEIEEKLVSEENAVTDEKNGLEEENILEEKIEEVVEEPIVYDNMTLEELANQLNKSLTFNITDKGYLIASYALEHNVDPFMATAIMLHETGCKWGCSYIVRECNNVGGQKGSGCGSYAYFNSLDEGIMAFIDNLERNYINYGLTTPDEINPKYAADPNWSANVNKYIEIIKAQ